MKIVSIACRLLVCALLMNFATSCKKAAEELLKDPCADLKICNIKSITIPGAKPATPNVFTFKYDAWGNPLSFTNTAVANSTPILVFTYDAQHRLKEFYKPFANGLFESWAKYVYDVSGRIIRDTTYNFGTVTPAGPANSYSYYVSNYTYDANCRIISTSTVLAPGQFPQTRIFNYDANGNLIKPGVVYDNNVNLHRTNKVFMFVDTDFSMNNPLPATKYNGYGLPSVIGPGPLLPGLVFLNTQLDNATIKFQCD